MGALRGWHIVVLLVVILLLFGAPKLPELARSVGKSLHILKDEAKSLTSDDDEPKKDAEADGDAARGDATTATSSDDETRGK